MENKDVFAHCFLFWKKNEDMDIILTAGALVE